MISSSYTIAESSKLVYLVKTRVGFEPTMDLPCPNLASLQTPFASVSIRPLWQRAYQSDMQQDFSPCLLRPLRLKGSCTLSSALAYSMAVAYPPPLYQTCQYSSCCVQNSQRPPHFKTICRLDVWNILSHHLNGLHRLYALKAPTEPEHTLAIPTV